MTATASSIPATTTSNSDLQTSPLSESPTDSVIRPTTVNPTTVFTQADLIPPPHITQPLEIGPVKVHSRVMLAPMAGVTDVVFRSLVRREAPESLICTEMISSNGLVYSKRFDHPILDQTDQDQPIAYQLAAHREEVLLEAARTIIQDKNPATLDLNMGCPVKKITGNFEGCSLMREPDLAFKLISALVKHLEEEGLKTPVTVKFRLGWDHEHMNYREFAKMCEDAGASMVTLHARTRAQGYKPGCLWEAFGELKQTVKIPVIANGDIDSVADAFLVMNTYGVDGVMIGRGALGQPWLIGTIDRGLKTGTIPEEPSLSKRLSMAYDHAALLVDYRGEVTAIREMRRHLTDYVRGFPGASQYRQRLTAVNKLEDVRLILDEFLDVSLGCS